MGIWRNETLGFLQESDLLDIGNAPVTRPADPADQLVGDQKTENLTAEWESISAEYNIPLMAQFHAFDTEAQKTVRFPIDSHNIEKGLIKVKINQSELLRQQMNNGVVRDAALYDAVMNDSVRLADQVATRTKVAKNEMLATGKVTIKENNLDITVDYGVPAEQTAMTIDFADDATVDIISQFDEIIQKAKDKGVILTGFMTAAKNISKLRKNAVLQKAINGNIGAGAMIRRADINDFLADEFGLNRIIENDLTYGLPVSKFGADGRPVIESRRYFPDNKITFFAANPAGRVGTGLWGNPPEVDIARFASVGTEPSVSPYIFIEQWAENDPAVIWTKASTLFMPVLYNPNSLWIATVEEAVG